jgi:hypothetical protein
MNYNILTKETPFGLVTITEKDNVRSLNVDGCSQGRVWISPEGDYHLASWYMRQMSKLINHMSWSNKKREALVLGGGAYLLPQYLRLKGFNVTVLEQNSVMPQLAKDYFKVESDKVNTVIGDARETIRGRGPFNLIINDLYDGLTKITITCSPVEADGCLTLENNGDYGLSFRFKD